MFKAFMKLLDFFIHPQAKQDMRRHIKIRGMVGLGLIYFLTVVIIAALSPSLQIFHVVLIISLIVSFFLGKYTGWHESLARSLLVLLCGVVLNLLRTSENMHTELSLWIPVIAVAGLFAGGSAFGNLILLGLGTGVTGIFYFKILPKIEASQVQAELRHFKQFLLATLVVYGLAFIYEKANSVLIDLAEKRRKALELQKQKTLEASHLSSLGEMAGGIAHEINNPLAIIRGNAEVLTRTLSTDPQAQMRLEKIIHTVERIEKIILSMRNLSRQDYAGEFQLENLANVIEEVLVFFSEKMRSLGYQLEVQLDQTIEAYCQRVQVGQIIINLMNNAIDALQEHQSEVSWIRLKLQAQGSFAEISIANSGPKIEEELARNLMRPFFTTKPVGKGTGLGLSISRNFAERHGGELILDLSTDNTVFILRLPSRKKSQLQAS